MSVTTIAAKHAISNLADSVGEIRVHPNSFNACRHFAESLFVHSPGPCRIADIGSYDVNGTYRGLFERPCWEYVGFDIRPGPNVDVHLSGIEWVLTLDYWGGFDVIISGQTMEHVAAPWRWIKQVARLGKPGALIWLAVPNTEVFHEHPIDAWRCWPDGMRAIFDEGGLETLVCRVEGPDTIGIARKPCAGT